MMMKRPAADDQDGFVLIEAVVALAILVAVLSLFYRGWSASTLHLRHSEHSATALQIAKERLERAGVETPLAAAAGSGTVGAHTWRVSVAPRPPALLPGTATVPRSFEVRVEVYWRDATLGRTHAIELDTIKLERAP